MAVIPLRSTSPWISSGLPESARGSALRTPFPKVHRFPIWPCSRWGLPCQPCCQGRGALLPHRFTLAVPHSGRPQGLGRSALCCTFREHASCAGEFPAQKTTPQALPGTLIRRSPDFPPPRPRSAFARHGPEQRLPGRLSGAFIAAAGPLAKSYLTTRSCGRFAPPPPSSGGAEPVPGPGGGPDGGAGPAS